MASSPKSPAARSPSAARSSACRSSACRSWPTRPFPSILSTSSGGIGPRRSSPKAARARRPTRSSRRHPLQRRSAHARGRPRPDRRGRRLLVRGRSRPGLLPPRVLTNASLDLAVAQGAAYYGVVRRGGGIRIGGGTARSFYVGLETDAAVKPWLCVVPRDAQEGEEIAITGHDFDLLMGQPVVVPAGQQLGPARRPAGRPGSRRPRLDPRAAAAPEPDARGPQGEGRARPGQPGGAGHRGRHDRALVPVADRRPPLAAPDPASWSGRPARPRRRVTGDESDRVVIEQSEIDAAIAAIRTRVRARRRPRPATRTARHDWSSDSKSCSTFPATSGRPRRLRALWEPLRDLAEHRLKSPSTNPDGSTSPGSCLRPGTGFPARRDPDQGPLARLPSGRQAHQGVQCWAEWWILWRRVAAGL